MSFGRAAVIAERARRIERLEFSVRWSQVLSLRHVRDRYDLTTMSYGVADLSPDRAVRDLADLKDGVTIADALTDPRPLVGMIRLSEWGSFGCAGPVVARSNHKVLSDDAILEPIIRQWHGDYGGEGILIAIADALAADDQTWEYLVNTLAALEDYPLLDDSDHSNLESQLIEESWDDDVRDDITRTAWRQYDGTGDIWGAISDDPEGFRTWWDCRVEQEAAGENYPEVEDETGDVIYPDDLVRRCSVTIAQHFAATGKVPWSS